MEDQLKNRLNALKAEFETGQKALAELESRVEDLKNTLLRISSAIDVLEEEMGKEKADRPMKPILSQMPRKK